MTAPADGREGTPMLYAYVGQLSRPPRVGFTPPPPGSEGLKGFTTFAVDEPTGGLERVAVTLQDEPSFLVVSPRHGVLFATHDRPEFEGEPGGAVHAYRLHPDGSATEIGASRLPFPHPMQASLDADERFLFVVCSLGGGIAVVPIADGGGVGDPSCVLTNPGVVHVPLGSKEGFGADGSRVEPTAGGQPLTFPHCILQCHGNGLVFVADRDLNRIFVYRFDAERGVLTPAETPWVDAPAGAGPRHMACQPDGRMLYVTNEPGSSVSRYSIDGDRGRAELVETVPTAPTEFAATHYSAAGAIRVLSSGRYVFVTNRGHDSIATLAVDPASGALEVVSLAPCGGTRPFEISLTPDERFLYCANRGPGGTITTFSVDHSTGELREIAAPIEIDWASSVAYWDAGR